MRASRSVRPDGLESCPEFLYGSSGLCMGNVERHQVCRSCTARCRTATALLGLRLSTELRSQLRSLRARVRSPNRSVRFNDSPVSTPRCTTPCLRRCDPQTRTGEVACRSGNSLSTRSSWTHMWEARTYTQLEACSVGAVGKSSSSLLAGCRSTRSCRFS